MNCTSPTSKQSLAGLCPAFESASSQCEARIEGDTPPGLLLQSAVNLHVLGILNSQANGGQNPSLLVAHLTGRRGQHYLTVVSSGTLPPQYVS